MGLLAKKHFTVCSQTLKAVKIGPQGASCYQRLTNVVGDVGGGIGENTIDELTDDLSVDYGVNLRGQTRGESDGRERVCY